MKSSSERRGLVPLALFAALLVSSCASPRAPQPPSTDVELMVLIYSGVPNPRAVLSEAQAAELVEKLADLPAAPEFERASVVPSILGYAGVVVGNGAEVPGLPLHLAVYDGYVELSGERTSFRRDPNGALEDWLIGLLVEAKQLDEAELRLIRAD